MPDIHNKPLSHVVTSLGIEHLFHFTPVKNLPGILEHGLLSRSKLAARGLVACCPDQLRLDQAPWSISLSISWPNALMLASKRYEQRAGRCPKLAILALDPALLSELRCRFIPGNAARKDLRPLVRRGPGRSAPDSADRARELLCLYQAEGLRSRPEDFAYPDDVQAEVLVANGPILPRHIRRIVLDDNGALLEALGLAPGASSLMCVDPALFGWRPLASVKWHPQPAEVSTGALVSDYGPF